MFLVDLSIAPRTNKPSSNLTDVRQSSLQAVPLRPPALMDAAVSSGIDVSAFYGKPAGKKTAEELLDLRHRYGKSGLKLRSVERPRLHAKVLGWDQDDIAITSFNWLSVDPNDQKPLREIGVRIKAARIAEHFLQDFHRAQW